MNYITKARFLFAILMLGGCSDANMPVPTETTVVLTSSKTPTSQPTVTATSAPTAIITSTVTPTQIVNPENLVLAEKGYDIADIRLSFPREDMMIIDFKYRFDESRKSKDTSVYITLPSTCIDKNDMTQPVFFHTEQLVGEATLAFKMTLQGVCSADVIEFHINHSPGTYLDPPFYTEFVQQPYRLVRNFPTANSDTVKIENIEFTPNDSWGGELTFDYAISDEIPLPLEQYVFTLNGFGPGQTCYLDASGSILEEHTGTYHISISLFPNIRPTNQHCLQGLDKFTYIDNTVTLNDILAQRWVYIQPLGMSLTFLKSP